MKKPRFKDQEGIEETLPAMSFQDKLLEEHQAEEEEEMMNREEDLNVDDEDVVVEKDGQIPSISFSQRVHAQLVKPWQNTVIVKLLEWTMGYRALYNRLETLWKQSQGFTVIDLENDFYLVRFKTESDAHYVLTQVHGRSSGTI